MADEFKEKIMSSDDVLKKVLKHAKTIAFGGMGGQSVPKIIPGIIGENSESFTDLTLYTGGGTTKSFEEKISKAGIGRRFYYLSDLESRSAVNAGKILIMDYSVSKYSRLLNSNPATKIDVAVFEATSIEKDGVVLSLSVDSTPSLVDASKKVIIELNMKKPNLNGLHDIYTAKDGEIIPLTKTSQRIGSRYLKIAPKKIGAIIYSNEDEGNASSYGSAPLEISEISNNVWEVLRDHIKFRNSMPLQVGAGSVASSLVDNSPFDKLKIWCEIAPTKWADYLDSKIAAISASALYNIPGDENYTRKFLDHYNEYTGKVVLRPNNITNSPELISRLGVIVIQQAVEIDIFGAVNVSHINGNIHNGVGGSIDFCSNGKYVVVVLPSTANKGRKSRIVPMSNCIDVPRYMVDFVVTEIGITDLRWKDPRERAISIINNCAHPKFRDLLLKYYNSIEPSHMPFDLNGIIKWNSNQ